MSKGMNSQNFFRRQDNDNFRAFSSTLNQIGRDINNFRKDLHGVISEHNIYMARGLDTQNFYRRMDNNNAKDYFKALSAQNSRATAGQLNNNIFVSKAATPVDLGNESVFKDNLNVEVTSQLDQNKAFFMNKFDQKNIIGNKQNSDWVKGTFEVAFDDRSSFQNSGKERR